MLHTEGPLIIFAGAGTGKTRVITHRIAHLLYKEISPLNILAVTFTNKAAEEMRKRVDQLSPGTGRSVWISTFHSFAAKFLRIEAKALGLNPDFLIYDASDQKNVIKECIQELNLDDKKYKPAVFCDIISRAKDDLLDADSYQIHTMTANDPFRQTAAVVYGMYEKKLKKAGALDFGDLLLATVNALRDNEAVREKYQSRFRYVMIDEYQDTNHSQYLFAKYIAAKHRNICVVGDDDQSIYSWRGADIRNILEFERDYSDCKTVKLEENYRSTQNILGGAWNVIKNNSRRVEKKVWSSRESGNPVKLMENANAIEEAQAVVNEISLEKNQGGSSFNDFAVFYRTNAQSRVLEDAFRRSGIPYMIYGTLRFYERAEVKNILAYMRLVHNPHDNVAFKRVINVPKRGIGKTSLETLDSTARERNLSLWTALELVGELSLTPTARRALLSFKAFIEKLRLLKETEGVRKIALMIIEMSGYIKELEEENTPESKSRIENVKELISAIDEFESRSPDKTLGGYLAQVALVNDTDEFSEENDKVTLMTLHLAKGLEFKTVFVTGLEEGLFPIGEYAYDMDGLEEERRLMYVGMTRAKEKLYLSWAQERTIYGKTHWNLPSRFIEETKACAPAKSKPAAAPYERHEVQMVKVTTQSEEPEENHAYPLECRVRHAQFGEGKVIDRSGSGDDMKVVVLFDTGQWKKLMVKYAKLERLN